MKPWLINLGGVLMGLAIMAIMFGLCLLVSGCHWPGTYHPSHPRNPASWYIYTNQP